MGLLRSSNTLPWHKILKIKSNLKKNGISQFISVFKNSKSTFHHELIWGDEIETMICLQNRLYLNSEKVIDARLNVEFASFMVESTPENPRHSDVESLTKVEACMLKRIGWIGERLREINEGAYPLMVTCFFKVGMYESFVEPGGGELEFRLTQSEYFPDNAVTDHKRFFSFVENIIKRRGRKVEGYIKVMESSFDAPFHYKSILHKKNSNTQVQLDSQLDELKNTHVQENSEFYTQFQENTNLDADLTTEEEIRKMVCEENEEKIKENNEDVCKAAVKNEKHSISDDPEHSRITNQNLRTNDGTDQNLRTNNGIDPNFRTKETKNNGIDPNLRTEKHSRTNDGTDPNLRTEKHSRTNDGIDFNLRTEKHSRTNNGTDPNLRTEKHSRTNDGTDPNRRTNDRINNRTEETISDTISDTANDTTNDRIPSLDELVIDDDFMKNHIKIDSMGQGMGCCCLQLTLQASTLEEARLLYDSLAALCPLFLRLTRATPISQGRLLQTETRWDMLVFSVDCRTDEERGCKFNISGSHPSYYECPGQIKKSRFSSVDFYISENEMNLEEYNDLNVPLHERSYETLKREGVDERMARHVASLFVRDPILVYTTDNAHLNGDDGKNDGEVNKENSAQNGEDEYKQADNENNNMGRINSKGKINGDQEINSKGKINVKGKINENDINNMGEINNKEENDINNEGKIKEGEEINENDINSKGKIKEGEEVNNKGKINEEINNKAEINKQTEFESKNEKRRKIEEIMENSSIETTSLSSTGSFFTDDFENIQSSNWRSMRFKLPAQNGKVTEKGWKVEVRPMEIQPTAMENTSYCIFVVLLSKAIISQGINFYIPLSLVDENFRRANLLFNKEGDYKGRVPKDGAKFFYRRNIFEKGRAEIKEGTIEEIFMGDKEYRGIFNIVRESLNGDERLDRYLDFIRGRIQGDYMAVSDFMRKFVIGHGEYQGSVVKETVLDELIERIVGITEKNDVDYLRN